MVFEGIGLFLLDVGPSLTDHVLIVLIVAAVVTKAVLVAKVASLEAGAVQLQALRQAAVAKEIG